MAETKRRVRPQSKAAGGKRAERASFEDEGSRNRGEGRPRASSESRTLMIGVGAAAAVVIGAAVIMNSGGNAEVRVASADAGADAGTELVLDSKLAAALATASPDAGAGAPKASSALEGPPQRGVFEKGLADKAHAKEAPPRVEVIEQGAEPRTKLAIAAPDGEAQKRAFEVSLRLGQQGALPTIDFSVVFSGGRPEADEGDEALDARAPLELSARVAGAGLAQAQPGQVPREVGEVLAKLKGSKITYGRLASGGAFSPRIELGKGADAQLEPAMRALSEAISLLTPVVPDKPLGVGGYWMVTDRADALGIDVVRYRVFKVEAVADDGVTLSVDIRQYATSERPPAIPGMPPNMEYAVDVFESSGKGKVLLTPSTVVPTGELDNSMQARLKPAGGAAQGARSVLQTELSVKSSAP